jgi:hypothetical protein
MLFTSFKYNTTPPLLQSQPNQLKLVGCFSIMERMSTTVWKTSRMRDCGGNFIRHTTPLVDAIRKQNSDRIRVLICLLFDRGASANTDGGAAYVPLAVAETLKLIFKRQWLELIAKNSTNGMQYYHLNGQRPRFGVTD